MDQCARRYERVRSPKTPQALTGRSKFPSAGQMMSDQTGLYVKPEIQEELARRLAPDL